MTRPVTDKQRGVLAAVQKFWEVRGVAPSLADLAADLELSRATIHEHLQALKRKGPLIELSSQIFLHKFNSPAWLKHIQKANAALGGLTPEKMSHLRPGEAYVWSSKATDESFTKGAVKVKLRPRVTQHGGATKTAVEE